MSFTLSVKLTADAQGLVGQLRLSREALDELRGESERAARDAADLTGANDRLRTGYGALRNAIAALGLAELVKETIALADTYQQVDSRLRIVTTSLNELRQAEAGVYAVAQQTRSSYESTADLYGRLARTTRDLSLSQADLLSVTKTVNEAVKISGGPVASAEAALFQLGQAFAAGALRGQDLNSVLEQTPRLAQAIAEGMGKTTGELRALAEQGKLTTQVVVTALKNQAGTLDAEFAQMTQTVSDAFVQLDNALLVTVGKVNAASGFTRPLVDAVGFLRTAIEDPSFLTAATKLGKEIADGLRLAGQALTLLADNFKAVAAVVAGVLAARMATAVVAAVQAIVTANAGAIAGFRLMATVSRTAALEMVATAAAAKGAALAMDGLKAGLAFFGGPVGAAVFALTTAIGFLATQESATEKATRLHDQALNDLNATMDAAKGKTDALTAAAKALQIQQQDAVAAAAKTAIAQQESAAKSTASYVAHFQFPSGPAGDQDRATWGPAQDLARQFQAGKISALDMFAAIQHLSEASPALKPLVAAMAAWAKPLNDAQNQLNDVNAALAKLQDGAKAAGGAVTGAATQIAPGIGTLRTGLNAAAQSIGLVIDNGHLMTQEASDLAKHQDTLNQILGLTPDKLAKIGVGAGTVLDLYQRLTDKSSALGAELKKLNDQAAASNLAPGADQQRHAALVAAGADGPLDRHDIAKVNNAVDTGLVGDLQTQNKLLQQRAVLEKAVAEAAGGTAQAQADAQRKLQVYNQALTTYGAVVATAVVEGKKLPPDLQAYADALAAIDGHKIDGNLNQATAAMDLQAAAARRLADAAGQGEAAQRAAADANKIAEASARSDAEAKKLQASLTIQEAETRRGIMAEYQAQVSAKIATDEAAAAAVADGQQAEADALIVRQAEIDALRIAKAGTDDYAATVKTLTGIYRDQATAANDRAGAEAVQQAQQQLDYAKAELAVMGQQDGARQRDLVTLRIQAQAMDRFHTLTSDAAKQWIALQEQIADTEALKKFADDVHQTADQVAGDISQALIDGMTDKSKGFKAVLDAFGNLFKQIAAQAIKSQIILPITTQIVGSVPGLFGIQAPAGAAAGTAAGTTAGTAASAGQVAGVASSTLAAAGRTSGQGGVVASPGLINSAWLQQPVFGWGQAGRGTLPGDFVGPPTAAQAAANQWSWGGALGGAAVGAGLGSLNIGGGNQTGSTIGGLLGGVGGSYLATTAAFSWTGPFAPIIGALAGSLLGGLFGGGDQPNNHGLRVTRNLAGQTDTEVSDNANSDIRKAASSIDTAIDKMTSLFGRQLGGKSGPGAVTYEVSDKYDWTWSVGGKSGTVAKGDQDALMTAIAKAYGQQLQDVAPEVAHVFATSTASTLDDLLNQVDFASKFKASIAALKAGFDVASAAFNKGVDDANQLGTSLLDFLDQTRSVFKVDTSSPALGAPGKIAQYAVGTGAGGAAKGWAWVGEAGPELVNFSGGETVIPHERSLRLAMSMGQLPGYETGTTDSDRGYSGGEGANSGSGGAGANEGGIAESRTKDDRYTGPSGAVDESRTKDDNYLTTHSYMVASDVVDSTLHQILAGLGGVSSRVAQDPNNPDLWGVENFLNPALAVMPGGSLLGAIAGATGTHVPGNISLGVTPASWYEQDHTASGMGANEGGQFQQAVQAIQQGKALTQQEVQAIQDQLIAQQKWNDLIAKGGVTADFLDGLSGTIEALGNNSFDATGKDLAGISGDLQKAIDAFTKAGQAVPDSLMSARQQMEALVAVKARLDAQIKGDTPDLTEVQSQVEQAKGYWSTASTDLVKAMQSVGYTGDLLTAKLNEGLTNALAKLAKTVDTNADRQINDVTGKGYRNEIDDQIAGYQNWVKDLTAVGLSTDKATQILKGSITQYLDGANLTKDALDDIISRYKDNATVVGAAQAALDKLNAALRDTNANILANAQTQLGNTLPGKVLQFDQSAKQQLTDAANAGADTGLLQHTLDAQRAQLIFETDRQDYLDAIDRQIRSLQDNSSALQTNYGELMQLRASLGQAATAAEQGAASPLDLKTKLDQARKAFDDAVAQFNDPATTDAARQRIGQQLQSLGQTRIDAARNYYGSTNFDDFNAVISDWQSIGNVSQDQLDTAQQQVDQNDRQIALLQAQRDQAQRLGEAQVGKLDDLNGTMQGAYATLQAMQAQLAAAVGSQQAVPLAEQGLRTNDQVAGFLRSLGYAGQFGGGAAFQWLGNNSSARSDYLGFISNGAAGMQGSRTNQEVADYLTSLGWHNDGTPGNGFRWLADSGHVSDYLAFVTPSNMPALANSGLPGFATGGDMDVPGNGGIDSRMVAFRASPGERVKVRTPGQAMAEERAATTLDAVLTELRATNDRLDRVAALIQAAGEATNTNLVDVADGVRGVDRSVKRIGISR